MSVQIPCSSITLVFNGTPGIERRWRAHQSAAWAAWDRRARLADLLQQFIGLATCWYLPPPVGTLVWPFISVLLHLLLSSSLLALLRCMDRRALVRRRTPIILAYRTGFLMVGLLISRHVQINEAVWSSPQRKTRIFHVWKSGILATLTQQINLPLPLRVELPLTIVSTTVTLIFLSIPACSQYASRPAWAACLTPAGALSAAPFVDHGPPLADAAACGGAGSTEQHCEGLETCWAGLAATQLWLGFFVPLAIIYFVERTARRRFVQSLQFSAPVYVSPTDRSSFVIVLLQLGWTMFLASQLLVFGRL